VALKAVEQMAEIVRIGTVGFLGETEPERFAGFLKEIQQLVDFQQRELIAQREILLPDF